MSLDWDATKVKDYDKLTDRERAIMDTLIWYTIGTGIGDITEKTAPEFYARIKVREKLFDTMSSVNGEPFFIKPEHVKRFIGLKTNVFPKESVSKFAAKVIQRAHEEAMEEWKNDKT
jgi:hypothetical protein